MEEEKKIEDVVEISLVNNADLIKMYQDVESFLKYLDEEIKKTDVGDENEEKN